MNDKIVICDIDSTMCDHWKRIRKNTIPSWPGGVISSKAWSREEVLQDELLPRCSEFLWRLQCNGFYIRYLTARGWPHARQITVEQLTNWNVPNPQDVMFTSNLADKVSVLSSNICNYYVDDFMTGQENAIGTFHSETAKAIESIGIYVVVFRNDWMDVWEQIQIYEQRSKNAV
jgi:hypothetical protein